MIDRAHLEALAETDLLGDVWFSIDMDDRRSILDLALSAEGYRKALVEQGLLQKTASGSMVWHALSCPASFDFDECNYRCRVAREALGETR